MTDKFQEIKTEILRRAKEAEACTEQYGRAYKAETLAELMNVVKDNFGWACRHNVIDAGFIAKYHDEFANNQIYYNKDVTGGYLLANGNAQVWAYGNAQVEAYGNAQVWAYDNAQVEAYDNAIISSYNIKRCVLNDNAIYRVIEDNTIYYANPNLKFVKQ